MSIGGGEWGGGGSGYPSKSQIYNFYFFLNSSQNYICISKGKIKFYDRYIYLIMYSQQKQ